MWLLEVIPTGRLWHFGGAHLRLSKRCVSFRNKSSSGHLKFWISEDHTSEFDIRRRLGVGHIKNSENCNGWEFFLEYPIIRDFIPNLFLLQKTDLVSTLKLPLLCCSIFLALKHQQLRGTAPLADKPISALTFSMTGITTGSLPYATQTLHLEGGHRLEARSFVKTNAHAAPHLSLQISWSNGIYHPSCPSYPSHPSHPSNHCPVFIDFSTSTFPPCHPAAGTIHYFRHHQTIKPTIQVALQNHVNTMPCWIWPIVSVFDPREFLWQTNMHVQ